MTYLKILSNLVTNSRYKVSTLLSSIYIIFRYYYKSQKLNSIIIFTFYIFNIIILLISNFFQLIVINYTTIFILESILGLFIIAYVIQKTEYHRKFSLLLFLLKPFLILIFILVIIFTWELIDLLTINTLVKKDPVGLDSKLVIQTNKSDIILSPSPQTPIDNIIKLNKIQKVFETFNIHQIIDFSIVKDAISDWELIKEIFKRSSNKTTQIADVFISKQVVNVLETTAATAQMFENNLQAAQAAHDMNKQALHVIESTVIHDISQESTLFKAQVVAQNNAELSNIVLIAAQEAILQPQTMPAPVLPEVAEIVHDMITNVEVTEIVHDMITNVEVAEIVHDMITNVQQLQDLIANSSPEVNDLLQEAENAVRSIEQFSANTELRIYPKTLVEILNAKIALQLTKEAVKAVGNADSRDELEKTLKTLKKATEDAIKFAGFVKKAEQDLLKKVSEDFKNIEYACRNGRDGADIVLDSEDHFSSNYYTKSFDKSKNTATKAYLADMIAAESKEDNVNATFLSDIKKKVSAYSEIRNQLQSETQSPDKFKALQKKAKNCFDVIKSSMDSREYFKRLSRLVVTQYRNTLDAARSKVRLLKFWKNCDLSLKQADIDRLVRKQKNNQEILDNFKKKQASFNEHIQTDLNERITSRMSNDPNLLKTEVIAEETEIAKFLRFENVLNDIRSQKDIPVRLKSYSNITNRQKHNADMLYSYTDQRERIEKIVCKHLPKGSEEEIRTVTDNAYRKRLACLTDSNNPGLLITPELVASWEANNSDAAIAEEKRNVTLNYSNDEEVIPSEKLNTHSLTSYQLFKQSEAQFNSQSQTATAAAERRFSELLGLKLRLKTKKAGTTAVVAPVPPVVAAPVVAVPEAQAGQAGGAAGVGYASPHGAYESKGK